jgi:hypothetical protein
MAQTQPRRAAAVVAVPLITRDQAKELADHVITLSQADQTRVNIVSEWSGNTSRRCSPRRSTIRGCRSLTSHTEPDERRRARRRDQERCVRGMSSHTVVHRRVQAAHDRRRADRQFALCWREGGAA